MNTYRLQITAPRPYFAEIPYYLWGQVNYDSEGDCNRPTDQFWTEFDLTNRETGDSVAITQSSGLFAIEASPELAAQTTQFLISRCGAALVDGKPDKYLSDWDHDAALARTLRVQREFARPELVPFDSHLFWGSWKWVGWYASEFTWIGRWIMNALLTGDTRAVNLCVFWLQDGTYNEDQSKALRYALHRFTGLDFASDQEWVEWYFSPGPASGQKLYPEPDFKQWLADLQA
jgi:hypothetical protein